MLLLGELGSGREAYARYLHSLSARASKPFFMVVAASLGKDPTAALFGSERDGRVELGALDQAAGGSLYLNGLEDLNSEAQRALAGAIEQNGYTRVGGRQRVPLNVRWISSAQDSFELHASPEPFRRDLVAHLNVITLRVPPLRDYAEDVPDLLRYYVDRLVDDQHLPLRRFSVAAQNRLRNYPWPGNVGELKNLVQRVLILGVGEEIRLEEIERELAVQARSRRAAGEAGSAGAAACAKRANNSSAPTCSSSCCCAMARSGSWPSGWAWSAPTCIANCGHWESIFGN